MDNTASCMIEVCDLHKHYKDVHVLRGISTTVAKGEVCAVIGPSGSGKSTFLRCLNRLEEASSGEIFINAQEITDPHLNLNKMRENIGMVFQGFNLFPHMTALENVMDPMHGTYLHSSSHSMAEGDRKADMVLQPTKTGFIFEKKGQSGVNFDWVELGNSGTCWMRLSIPYKKRFGPGGHFFIVGMVVPEDNDNCRVFFWRIRRVQGWQRDMWRFMYRNRLEKLHWEVLEQDRVVLESLAPNARDHEYLYQHDVGLSRLRRMMQKAAKEQLAMREAQQGAA